MRWSRIIRRLIEIRRSVLQLDVLVFTPERPRSVATNAPDTPLPFTEADADEVRHGGIVSRRVASGRRAPLGSHGARSPSTAPWPARSR